MNLFSKLINKNNKEENLPIVKEENNSGNSLVAVSNYMIADVRRDYLLANSSKTPISALSKLGSEASSVTPVIKEITLNKKNGGSNLYKITNLNMNDSLKTTKKGITYGAVNKFGGKSELAKLEQVQIDPNTLMMAAMLYQIESQLNDIIDISKKIYSFLEHDKEAEIEADLETLTILIREFKYNCKDSQYLANNHKHVMDIKRTAKKNMNFYKKEITDDILKNNLVVTNQTMNTIQSELENKFKYYCLSLFTYSFSSFLEIILLNNFQEDYLLSKKEELEDLDSEYINNFELASKFITQNANKSLEGNLLHGIGTTGKAIGSLAEKVPIMKNKNIDQWFNEKGEELNNTGDNIKNEFVKKFDEIKDSNTKPFIKKVEDINNIYNKTKEIYFDNENIYLVMK